jgi:polyisoprenoid-binding protein YceI
MNATKRKIIKISALNAVAAAAVALGLTLLLTATAAPPLSQLAASSQQSISAPADEIFLTLDPAQSKVHYSVDSTLHTVHGTFNLKSGAIYFNPQTGQAAGQIIVYATSGESGNTSRDTRMHKEILETAKFPEAAFRPTQIEGQINSSGASDIKLHGILSLHGADHDLTAQVHAVLAPDHWTATATFDVPYISWGIKDPSNFFLKIKPIVNVELDLSGPHEHK